MSDFAGFERMCSALLAGGAYPGIDPLGGTGDGGRDAIIRRDVGGQRIIFAYTVRQDWATKLQTDCERVKELDHRPDVFVFVCTKRLSASDKDRAQEIVSEGFGWTLDLFDVERLRALLVGKHWDLVARHPSIFDPRFFQDPAQTSAAPVDANAIRIAVLAAMQVGAALELAIEHLCNFGGAILFASWEKFADNEQMAADMFDPLKPIDFQLVSKLAPLDDLVCAKILNGYALLNRAERMLKESLPSGRVSGVLLRLPWTEERDVAFKALLSSSLDDLRAAAAICNRQRPPLEHA